MSDAWTHAVLAERVGEPFGARVADREVRLELVEARALPVRDPGDPAIRSAPFTLLFRVAEGDALPQDNYDVEHAELGSMQMFLVPVGGDLVEAVFN